MKRQGFQGSHDPKAERRKLASVGPTHHLVDFDVLEEGIVAVGGLAVVGVGFEEEREGSERRKQR
jgi:hypothetical protein